MNYLEPMQKIKLNKERKLVIALELNKLYQRLTKQRTAGRRPRMLE